jgi:hypothetical protein
MGVNKKKYLTVRKELKLKLYDNQVFRKIGLKKGKLTAIQDISQ